MNTMPRPLLTRPSSDSRAGNCLLWVLLILAVLAIVGLAVELYVRDAADEEARRTNPSSPKSAEEQELERAENLVFLGNPEIARDPKIDLSNRSVAVMETQLALARRRLEAARRSRETAAANLKRDKDSQWAQNARLDERYAEWERAPDDDDLAEEIGEMELRVDETKASVVQAQADLALLRSYEKHMARLVQDMESALEKARRSGEMVVATADMDALKVHYSAAMSAGTVAEDQRRNAMPAATATVAEEEGRSTAARERARARLEQRRLERKGGY